MSQDSTNPDPGTSQTRANADGFANLWRSEIIAIATAAGPQGLVVFAYLRSRANSNSEAWPSLNRMADEFGWSDDTIRRAIKKLADCGCLEVIAEQGKPSVYRLTKPTRNYETLRKSADTPTLRKSAEDPTQNCGGGIRNSAADPPQICKPIPISKRTSKKPNKKPRKREQSARTPELLIYLIERWNSLGFSEEKTEPITKTNVGLWNRLKSNPDLREFFQSREAIDELIEAVRCAKWAHSRKTFGFNWLFEKNTEKSAWKAASFMKGAYVGTNGSDLINRNEGATYDSENEQDEGF